MTDLSELKRQIKAIDEAVAEVCKSEREEGFKTGYQEGWDAAIAFFAKAASQARTNSSPQLSNGITAALVLPLNEQPTARGAGKVAEKIAFDNPGLPRKAILEKVRKIIPDATEKAISNGLYRSERVESKGGVWVRKSP